MTDTITGLKVIVNFPFIWFEEITTYNRNDYCQISLKKIVIAEEY